MQNKNYKICVVGAGHWGKNHISTLSELNALSGIVEKDQNIREKFKLKYPSCRFYDSLERALEADYDGFVVATPPKTHYEIAKKVILSKVPVLVEKPLTLNLEDANSLNQLAKDNEVILMVGHLLLFHPAFNKIKSMINAGMIGEIQYIYSNRLNLGTFRTDENVFWSFAPHDIALFYYFFNNEPTEIISTGIDYLQSGIHDSTITTIKY